MRTGQWPHQAKEFEISKGLDERALLWGMRSGKSKQVVDTACHRHEEIGDAEGSLILAPNGVHLNWIKNEIPKHSWSDHVGLAWSSRRSGRDDYKAQVRQFLDTPKRHGLKWLAVNSEALILPRVQELINEFRTATNSRTLLVADECQDFRRPGSRRTFLARGLAKHMPIRRILSGTALLNSPLHAFSQYELLRKGALGFTTFKDFKDRYAVYEKARNFKTGRSYPLLKEYINMDELKARIAEYSSVVLREDVEGMPTLLEVERPIELSELQQRAYDDMASRLIVEIGDKGISAKSGGIKMMKLHQIVSGFIIDERGDVVSIDDSPPILDAMVEQVEGTLPGKVVIWCRFREDIRRVCERLRSLGYRVGEFHGGVTDTRREADLDAFQNDPSMDVLVGQPQAGGVGRNMSAADAIIWYSSVPDAIFTNQAKERATAVGGKTVTIITLSTPGTVHELIVDSNAGKFELADRVSGRGLRDFLAQNL